jgi:3-deoxy-D-manno-octulosonate 8-phosphate phosphatase (KDO 8-P phosphatase)
LPELIKSMKYVHTVAFDFDGVFTDNKVWVDQEGRESVLCDRADGLAFDMVRAFQKLELINAQFFILSKEKNSVVIERAKKLKLTCHYGVDNKLNFFKKYLLDRFPDDINPFSGVIYLGNDLNDLPLMQHVGLAVAPSDAHTRVKKIAHKVMECKGGNGFVREFIEHLLDFEQLTSEEINEIISNC